MCDAAVHIHFCREIFLSMEKKNDWVWAELRVDDDNLVVVVVVDAAVAVAVEAWFLPTAFQARQSFFERLREP